MVHSWQRVPFSKILYQKNLAVFYVTKRQVLAKLSNFLIFHGQTLWMEANHILSPDI